VTKSEYVVAKTITVADQITLLL